MSRSATLLFAAHDIGGGRVLAPVAAAYRAAGHRVAVLADGPAREVLAGEGASGIASLGNHDDLARVLSDLRPAVAVTGTSATATLEHGVWDAARRLGIPSVAIVDAWINLSLRFRRTTDGGGQPDVICTIDDESRRELELLEEISARIEVVGQPHLERVADSVASRRRLPEAEARFVYFSEPMTQGPGEFHRVGYDQFTVVERLLPGLAGIDAVSLVIKPHPNESAQCWDDWLAGTTVAEEIRVSIATGDALDLMAEAHGVMGLASMALIESSLAGIPTLALQPARRYCPNRKIDANPAIWLVVDPSAIVESTRSFAQNAVAHAGAASAPPQPFAGSLDRLIRVIDTLIQASRRIDAGARATGTDR